MRKPERVDGIGGLLVVEDRRAGYVEGLPAVAAAALDAVEAELRPPPPTRPMRRAGGKKPSARDVLAREFGPPKGKPSPRGSSSPWAWIGTGLPAKEGEEVVELVVVESHRGRVTGHAIACGVHGAFPRLLDDQGAAVVVAGRHLELEHGGIGHVRIAHARGRGRR